MSQTVRLGIIGCGAITQVAHLPVLKKLKGLQVVALCDIDHTKTRALASRFGVPDYFDDIEDLLEHEALDALLVASPNHLHESHVLAGLSAGLHVLVERPVAMTAASAQKVLRAAEKQDRRVLVGMNHRYRPDVQIVRGFLQHGELGRVESVRGSWHAFRPVRAPLGWRQRRDQAGGGAMLDLGLAILDLGLWLAGPLRPARASAALDRDPGERAVEHSGSAFVLCEDGPSLFLDVTRHHVGEAERFGLGLRATKGTAGINPLHVWKDLNGVPTDVAPTGSGSRDNAFVASFRAMWAHFHAIVTGEAPAPSLEEQVTLHKVMDAIYRAAAEGRDVAV